VASDFHDISYELDGPVVSAPKKLEWTCANGHRIGMQLVETDVDELSDDQSPTDPAADSVE
jgi:hypothetical protein